MMSTFSTALQSSVPVRQQQETALPQTTPKFEAFDSTTELWTDYWSRFSTFTKANSVPDVRVAKVFLTNQTATIYKLLSTLAAQETPPRTVNNLTMNEIQQYMMNEFHPKRFVVRERFRYWNDMKKNLVKPFKNWLPALDKPRLRATLLTLKTLWMKPYELALFVQSIMKQC